MIKIYKLTEESILMDLLVLGCTTEDAEEINDTIIEELEGDRYVMKSDGTYIVGELTATCLEMKYNICGTTYYIE